MTDAEILSMTKCNLELLNNTHDTYISMLISAAKLELSRVGITLALDNIDDCNLVVMYASYLYQKRKGEDTYMPRMLRYAINQRVFSEKVGDTDAT